MDPFPGAQHLAGHSLVLRKPLLLPQGRKGSESWRPLQRQRQLTSAPNSADLRAKEWGRGGGLVQGRLTGNLSWMRVGALNQLQEEQ